MVDFLFKSLLTFVFQNNISNPRRVNLRKRVIYRPIALKLVCVRRAFTIEHL